MEAELIYFTTKSGINYWNQTPPVHRDVICDSQNSGFGNLHLRQVFTQKKKIKAIASFTQCENAIFRFVISHHLSIYLRYYDLILANFKPS